MEKTVLPRKQSTRANSIGYSPFFLHDRQNSFALPLLPPELGVRIVSPTRPLLYVFRLRVAHVKRKTLNAFSDTSDRLRTLNSLLEIIAVT
jgi:hypothetical protein